MRRMARKAKGGVIHLWDLYMGYYDIVDLEAGFPEHEDRSESLEWADRPRYMACASKTQVYKDGIFESSF